MSKVKVGNIYKLTSGRDAEVTKLLPNARCEILIVNTPFTQECLRFKLSNGEVKDNYFPIVAGIGYFGNGEYRAFCKGRSTREYTLWTHMLERCYDGTEPSYADVSVCTEWHNFQTFAKWCNEQPEFRFKDRWALDKDISFFKTGVAIYSPNTCFFVPATINNLFLLREADRGDLPLGVREVSGKYYARVQYKNKRLRSPRYKNISEASDWYYKIKNEVKDLLADEYVELLSKNCYDLLKEIKILDPLLFKRV